MDKIRIGTLKVSEPGDYESGIHVECFTYANTPEPIWCVPAWDERDAGDLEGPFPTVEAAQAALDAYRAA